MLERGLILGGNGLAPGGIDKCVVILGRAPDSLLETGGELLSLGLGDGGLFLGQRLCGKALGLL